MKHPAKNEEATEYQNQANQTDDVAEHGILQKMQAFPQTGSEFAM
ncbi:MAG: hypothetical protein QNJ16_15920 [Rhodobacter sp.]|nr:hypothetical protein [Rhodobacter sp.]